METPHGVSHMCHCVVCPLSIVCLQSVGHRYNDL